MLSRRCSSAGTPPRTAVGAPARSRADDLGRPMSAASSPRRHHWSRSRQDRWVSAPCADGDALRGRRSGRGLAVSGLSAGGRGRVRPEADSPPRPNALERHAAGLGPRDDGAEAPDTDIRPFCHCPRTPERFRFLKVRQARRLDRLSSLVSASWRSLGFLPPPSLLRAPVSLGGHRGSCYPSIGYHRRTDGDHLVRACLLPAEGPRGDRHHRPLPALDRLRRRQARRRAADHQPRPPRPQLHPLDLGGPDSDASRRVRVHDLLITASDLPRR